MEEKLDEKVDLEEENNLEEKLEEVKKKKDRLFKRQEKKEEQDKKDKLIKDLSESVQELQTKLVYAQAEFANFKRRKEEETTSMLKYKNFEFGLELLTIVDSLERALMVNEENLSEEVKKYLSGFRIMYNNLIGIMNKFEINEIDCLNKEFDHNTSQALMTEHVDNVESGMVIEVLQKGYMLKDKVLRVALVKVSE